MARLHKAVVRTIADVDTLLAEMVDDYHDGGYLVPDLVDELLDTRLRLMEMA